MEKSGKVEKNGKTLANSEVLELAREARIIVRSKAFTEIMQSMKYEACKVLYEKSKTNDDMVFGKAMLYNIDVLEQKLKQLSEIEK